MEEPTTLIIHSRAAKDKLLPIMKSIGSHESLPGLNIGGNAAALPYQSATKKGLNASVRIIFPKMQGNALPLFTTDHSVSDHSSARDVFAEALQRCCQPWSRLSNEVQHRRELERHPIIEPRSHFESSRKRSTS